jgi:spermidine synthase
MRSRGTGPDTLAVVVASGARLEQARLALLGAWSAALQTLLAREYLAAFGGNEAVLAAMLGPWLVLGAAGALAARCVPNARPGVATAALALAGPLGAAAVLAARVLPRAFPAGATPGLATAFGWATVLLALPCALSGLCFALLSRRPGAAGRAYLAESLGAGVAGALLALVVLGRVPAFSAVGGLVAIATLAAAIGAPRRLAAGIGAAGGALALALAALPVGSWALAVQARHLAGAVELPSPSASVVVTRTRGSLNVFVDRRPVLSGIDRAAAEELAHVPLALSAAPRAVLVLGVPPPGVAAEMARHGVRAVDVVVPDPTLASLLERDPAAGATSPGVRVRVLAADERRFLESRPGAYDAILLLSGEPASARESRLLSVELFRRARAALRSGGLFAVVLPGHAQVASFESRRLASAVRATLSEAFGGAAHVAFLPGASNFTLARRGGALDASTAAREIPAVLAARGIRPVHLTAATLADTFSPRRLREAERWSSLPEPASRDLRPTVLRLALDRVLAEHGGASPAGLGALALALLLGGLVVLGPRSRPVELAVLTSGGAGLSSQLVLMLAVQIATGALVREVGLLLAGFMLGAAGGAWAQARWALGRVGRPWSDRRVVLACDLGQAALVTALALTLPSLVAAGGWARLGVFAGTVLSGVLPGAQFAAAARTLGGRPETVGGTLWAADLSGAAIAALVTFTLAVPALGLPGTLFAVAAVKASSSVFLLLPAPRVTRDRLEPRRLGALLPLGLVGFVVLVTGERTHVPLYGFTFLPAYRIAAVSGLFVALFAAFEPQSLRDSMERLARRSSALRRRLGIGGERLVWFLLLLPVATFPLGRCYFTVPFLFCHVCPRPCGFGVVRPYAIPIALLANVHDHRFCERLCPLGTAQARCDGLAGRRARRLSGATILRLAALAFVAFAYFAAQADHHEGVQGEGLYSFFFRNAFAPATWTLVTAAGLLALSFFVRRPFCDALCPVGAVSSAVTGVDKLVRRKRAAASGAPLAGSATGESSP